MKQVDNSVPLQPLLPCVRAFLLYTEPIVDHASRCRTGFRNVVSHFAAATFPRNAQIYCHLALCNLEERRQALHIRVCPPGGEFLNNVVALEPHMLINGCCEIDSSLLLSLTRPGRLHCEVYLDGTCLAAFHYSVFQREELELSHPRVRV